MTLKRISYLLSTTICLALLGLSITHRTQASNNFILGLSSGWNLVSVPIETGDTISNVLSPINGKYAAVYAYDGQTYESYVPGSSNNTLTHLNAGRGYWIFMNEAASLTITGEADAPPNVHLKKDWNLVGYNRRDSLPVAQAFVSIADKVLVIYNYNVQTKTYQSYVFGSESGEFELLEAGKGYWVYAKETVTWPVKPSVPPTPSPTPIQGKITVSLIGQSILHQPGDNGTKTTGKNLFYYLVQWGNGQVQEHHYTISGAGLSEHMNNSTTNSLIKRGNDYFVMCEGTKYLWTRGRKTESQARDLGNRARAAGSIPVIYIPYAHNGNGKDEWFKTDVVMREYMAVAKNLEMPFIPVAHAIGEAVKVFSPSQIYNDEVHLKSDGQFLAGCVTWATLTLTPPESINYKGNTDGLRLDRNKLIQICRDTIKRYPPDAKLLTPKN
jgi:hypothetical protein